MYTDTGCQTHTREFNAPAADATDRRRQVRHVPTIVIKKDNGWRYSVRSALPQRDGENIDGQDLVFWYKAYMRHSPEEGSDLWHSSGIRLVITGAAPSPGSNDYCAVSGPCGAGQGDCDGNHEYQTGLVCRNDVGAKYGFRAIIDVCEVPQ